MCKFDKIAQQGMVRLEEVHQISSSDRGCDEKMSPVGQHEPCPLVSGEHHVTSGPHSVLLLQGGGPDQGILGSPHPLTV